jgi:hypothetical protein
VKRLVAALIPACLAGLALAWIVPRLDDVGVTVDEPQYFFSVERIQDWYGLLSTAPRSALRDSAITAAWDPPETRYWNPHPPAYKQLMALTEALAGETLGRVAGYRVAPAVQFALLVAGVSITGSVLAGPIAGAGAGLALLAMPRVVGHAHIAATDMPLTLFWFVAAIGLGLHMLRGGRVILLLAAGALGCAMATKFTGWLIPVAVLPWCLIERKGRGFLVWVVLGFLVAWFLTPPAWTHPFGQMEALFRESITRETHTEVSTRYFGVTYGYIVPWHHPFVMTLITVPVGVLALATAGLFGFVRDKRAAVREDEATTPGASVAGLAVLQIVFFLALVALPHSPNHDGVRQWLPMFPFVALLAGLGFSRLARLADLRRAGGGRAPLVLALGAVFLLPGIWQTARVAPFYLSFYNGLIGGLPGARDRGMEISYWNDAITPTFLREAERALPPGSVVVGHPSPAYFRELQALGLVRGDLRFEAVWPPRYLLLIGRMSYMPDPLLPDTYSQIRPVVRTELDDVTLAGLYVLEGEPKTGSKGGP